MPSLKNQEHQQLMHMPSENFSKLTEEEHLKNLGLQLYQLNYHHPPFILPMTSTQDDTSPYDNSSEATFEDKQKGTNAAKKASIRK